MTVFENAYANGYDALYQDKDYVAECDLIEAILQRAGALTTPSRILDIGCGTGGHAIELARRGHVLAGIDRSADMLDIARHKAEQLPQLIQRPRFFCADALDFDASASPFDAALMMFAVIGYLISNDALLAALANIAKHLKPGGVFIFDCWWGPAVLTQRPSERVRMVETPTGKLLRVARTQLDTLTCVAEVRFDLLHLHATRAHTESTELHNMRYFFGPELELLFSGAGLRLERLGRFPEWETRPDDTSWNVVGIARKL